MDLGIRGRAALIGGASSGIGLAIAHALAAEGVRVAVVARRRRETEEAAAAIHREHDVEAIALLADLTEPGACERVVRDAAERFGGLDILIANAGGPPKGHFSELDDEAWRSAFELNYLTTVRLVRAALPGMQKKAWGRIVTVGSIVTQEPRSELALSSGVRAGLVSLTRLLARQHGREGITVNLLSPGYTMTQRQFELAGGQKPVAESETSRAFRAIAAEIPVGRMAHAEEIGAVAAFLCSTQAAFVSGINLVVDGAHTKGI